MVGVSLMKKTVAAIVVMLMGGGLYVSARSTSLTMFRWFDRAGLRDEVEILRAVAAPHLGALPRWMFFSLPQALWFFSGLLAFQCVWVHGGRNERQRWAWILTFSCAGFGMEVGQLFGILPGRFDPLDLVLLIVAWGLAMAIGSVERIKAIHSTYGSEVQRCSGT